MDNQMLSSYEYEALLFEDLKKNQPINIQDLPFTATSIQVPKSGTNAAFALSLNDTKNPDKIILHKAIIAAYNYVFFDKSAAVSSKARFGFNAKPFIRWLKQHKIQNRYKILKCYETDRMDELNNHGGESPLHGLRTILLYAIESEALRAELSSDDYAFLVELRKTKISPNLNKKQISIASYFGTLDWLRRGDVGIGNDLYSALASPKLAVNSLSLTAATIIIELNAYKIALKALLKTIEPELTPWMEVDVKNLSTLGKQILLGNVIYQILSAYNHQKKTSKKLEAAIDTLLLSSAINQSAYQTLLKEQWSQENSNAFFLRKKVAKYRVKSEFCKNNITSLLDGNLFSLNVLKALFSDDSSQEITPIEKLMFAWLMASLTVQPSDIPKLTHSSFREMKVGDRVTHIECEYFKGRAKVFYTTRSLSTRKPEGQALQILMDLQTKGVPFYTKTEMVITNGCLSLTGILNMLLQSSDMDTSLKAAHRAQGLPNLMPSALCALISYGIHTENCIPDPSKYSNEEKTKIMRQSESPCHKTMFGLQAVKNSAVHAFSDPYTLHFLINRNSHTNQTEKVNYLTADNEEWMNNSGRITREVMFDLIKNVFDLDFGRDDKSQMKKFNSEFMAVTKSISYKHEEMNSRLRLVTGQEKGKINEVGILSFSNSGEEEPLSPIYVVDNPITALKMYNYLHEFRKHYKKLLSHNADFLFKTVIPTVEWIEDTLTKLSKHSQQKGQEQFDLMVKNGVVLSVFHSM